MAGETRRQRRDARRAAGEPTPARGRPAPAGPDGTEAVAGPTAVVETGRRGGFVRESIGELKKVEWPNRAQVIQGTIVVIVACAIVGAYLWGADQILRPFVREVLLGQ
ncbi:MAG TPA: preprotein translocase subunit SecE [Gaiella sp.]|nr:preprotein translocase subunit SecE [Gaiella sp.]